jgi:prepilin-type N-terminal cleavage/methylation domain-containing protein
MRPRGFTLLETLVALAVSALVLTALYGAVGATATTRVRATERAERGAAERTVLVALAHELEAALASDPTAGAVSPVRFVVVDPPADGPPWSQLRFATDAGDDVRLVGYRVEPAGAGGRLVRRAASRFSPPDDPEPPGTTALDAVRAFRVRAFDGTTWTTSWTAPGLPRAVEIALGVDDGAGGMMELATAVTLPLGRR